MEPTKERRTVRQAETSPAPWSVSKEDHTAIIRDANRRFVTAVSIYTNTDEANARLIATSPEMRSMLERIVTEEQARYDRAYRAAVAHNNAEGVGVRFDYAPYPALPAWFNEAQDIIARAKEGER